MPDCVLSTPFFLRFIFVLHAAFCAQHEARSALPGHWCGLSKAIKAWLWWCGSWPSLIKRNCAALGRMFSFLNFPVEGSNTRTSTQSIIDFLRSLGSFAEDFLGPFIKVLCARKTLFQLSSTFHKRLGFRSQLLRGCSEDSCNRSGGLGCASHERFCSTLPSSSARDALTHWPFTPGSNSEMPDRVLSTAFSCALPLPATILVAQWALFIS
jgi:hypothetical protein